MQKIQFRFNQAIVMRSLFVLGVVSCLLITVSSAQGSTIFSGISLFQTTGTGQSTGVVFTTGVSGDYDAYASTSSTGASFINPAGQTNNLGITLNTGVNTFYVFADSSGGAGLGGGATIGANLFFNSATTTPGISVKSTTATSTSNFPAFSANGNASTYALAGDVVASVPGSNSLVFHDPSGYDVTLTSVQWQSQAISGLNKVSPIGAVAPNGANDHVLMVELTVAAVPEPSTIAFAGFGAIGLVIAARRRK